MAVRVTTYRILWQRLMAVALLCLMGHGATVMARLVAIDVRNDG